MKIFSIELNNFRQYKGKKKIELSTEDGKNFTIIQGPNGSGKTNLLNAITWCLYGEEKHLSRIAQEMIVDPVNRRTLEETKEGEFVEMHVELILGNDKPEYRIKRKRRGYKLSDKDINYENDQLDVLRLSNRDWKRVETQPKYFINLLLPSNIHHFFFFDGEKLDDFFKKEGNKQVKEAIIQVSQIDLLDKTIEHLNSVISDIRRSAKGLNPSVDYISSQIEKLEKELKEDRNYLESLKMEKSKIEEEIGEIETKLRQSSIEDVKRLQKDRDILNEEINKLDNELNSVKEKSIEHLVSKAPYIYAQDAIMFTSKLINEKYQKGDLPPKIREEYIRELLQSGECICGTDISKEGPHRTKLEELLKIAMFSKIDNEITEGKFIVKSILKDMETFIQTRDDYGTRIKDLEDAKVKKQQRLKEISDEIKSINIDEITKLEDDRKKLKEKEEKLLIQIGSKQHDINRKEKDLQKLNSDYVKELNKDKQLKYINKQLELCNTAFEAIKTIKEEVVKEIREIVEKKTKEYFLSLIWKKESFTNIVIDENYNISVIHKGGWNALPVLSAGERQVLALSFMTALKEATRVDWPVVIDTPLGRISGEPKDNIAELLPEYLKDTQVTILVTDQEYTTSVRQKLLPWIGKEYRLVFDEKNVETTVVPYGR